MTKLWILVALTLISRSLVIWVLPLGIHSLDLKHYLDVIELLEMGTSPYVGTPYYNYGSLWYQILWVLNGVSDASGFSLEKTVKFFLAVSECLLVALTYRLGSRRASESRAFWAVLIGLVANPVTVLLTCVHSSFDALVAAALVAVLLLMDSFLRLRDNLFWYAACLVVSAGTVLKTIPILAAPLLLQGSKSLRSREVLFGLSLVTLILFLGIGGPYVLFPEQVRAKVFQYASVPGYFGITGIFRLLGFDTGLDDLYSSVFKASLAALISLLGLLHLRNQTQDGPLSLAILISFILSFGPGFGPQYLFWLIPIAILLALPLGTPRFVTASTATLLFVATLTYIFEYSRLLGISELLAIPNSSNLDYREVQKNETLSRLPLFVCMLAFFAACCSNCTFDSSSEADFPAV